MDNPPKYIVRHLVVKNPVPNHLLEKFKGLRLEAIRLESAITAYNDEPSFTDEEWADRMTSPTHHYLICEHVRHQLRDREKHELGLSAASDNEWVGMFTLRGPLSQEQYDFKGRQGPSLGSDEEETRWFFFGLYLRSEHRGTEINTTIHEAVLDHLRVWTDEALTTECDDVTGMEKLKKARIRGLARSANPALKGLYQALEAHEVGAVDRADLYRAVGYDGLIGIPDGEKEYVVMERIIDC